MLSVLLIEPHEDICKIYAPVLQSLDFRVHTTTNTDDACELVSYADVLVTELQVPGRFDGIAMIRWIRSHPANHSMPIVVLTASADRSHQRAARTAGCDLFLTKPCRALDLATGIRHAAMWRSGLTVMLKAKLDLRQDHSRDDAKTRRAG